MLGGALADLLVVQVGDDLAVVTLAADAIDPLRGIDPTRRLARVRLDGLTAAADAVVAGGASSAVAIARTLAAAEAAGGAAAALEMALEYAKVREQFGRTIGSFQAVKHHLANMLVDRRARRRGRRGMPAGRRPAARRGSLAAAVAATQALPAYVRNAEQNIQLLGGIGFTWEHDAHLHLRRARALDALFGPGAATDVTAATRAGATADGGIELPAEADQHRTAARAFKARYDGMAPDERLAALIDSGYAMPHWPAPFGRAATAIEQLVIDEELADVDRPDLGHRQLGAADDHPARRRVAARPLDPSQPRG